MTSLLNPKGPAAAQAVDPADAQNRTLGQRLRRLQQGGSNSTILTQAMGPPPPATPRATLTGMV